MKALAVVGALLLLVGDGLCDQVPPPSRNAPRVWLTSSDWGGNPLVVFALYTDDTVIYRLPNTFDDYRVVKLAPAEVRTLLDGLPLDRVGDLHPPMRYGSDGHTDCIHVRDHARGESDCLWEGLDYDEEHRRGHRPNDAPTPPDWAKIWTRLAAFSSPRAAMWIPARIDAGIVRWANDDLCGKSSTLAWPSEWPHPFLPQDYRPKGTVVARMQLPGAAVRTLRQQEQNKTPKGCPQPLLLDGAPVRVVFRLEPPAFETKRP